MLSLLSSDRRSSWRGDEFLAREVSPRRRLPAWFLSLTMHLFLLLVFGWLVQVSPEGAVVEPDRTGGIVLAQQSGGEEIQYFSETDADQQGDADAVQLDPAFQDQSEPSDAANALPAADAMPFDSGVALPSSEGAANLPGDRGLDALLAASERAGGRIARNLGGHEAETSVFGLSGTGNKFVYVFDRSGSMNGFGGRPLAAAKAELIESVQSLDKTHRFQIIFYNHHPTIFNPFPNQPARMLTGSEAHREMAENYVRNMAATGGTEHMEALRMALAMHPDVIFFLTDADDPQLTRGELDEIRRRNRRVGATIHAIEFGIGPFRGRNFLVQLAEQNDGRHAYVDVTQLPSRSSVP
jgi:hypothetical protein